LKVILQDDFPSKQWFGAATGKELKGDHVLRVLEVHIEPAATGKELKGEPAPAP
jgi:hypothetical protein